MVDALYASVQTNPDSRVTISPNLGAPSQRCFVTTPTSLNCSICNQPVDLETTKTDDYGNAVHEECYVMLCVSKTTTPHTTDREVKWGS